MCWGSPHCPLPLVAYSGLGLLYQKEAELLDAMELLQTNSDLRRQLGENGHAAYLEGYTEERHLEQYLGLIESIRQKSDSAKTSVRHVSSL